MELLTHIIFQISLLNVTTKIFVLDFAQKAAQKFHVYKMLITATDCLEARPELNMVDTTLSKPKMK